MIFHNYSRIISTPVQRNYWNSMKRVNAAPFIPLFRMDALLKATSVTFCWTQCIHSSNRRSSITCPSIHPPLIRPISIQSSIHLSIQQTNHPSIRPSIQCPFTRPSIHPMSIHSSILPSNVHSLIHPPIHPMSIHSSIRPSNVHSLIHPPIQCPFTHPSTHPSVHLPNHPPFDPPIRNDVE